MPSTYTLNNGIELIATGEQSGTWGDRTNVNLGLIDTALDGQVTITLAAAGTSGSPNTLPISDGSASDGRNRLIIFTDGGDLGATAFVQLTPNDAEKIVYIRNNLTGGRAITLFQGTYNASNDYEVPAGTTAVVFFNGGGTGAVAANVFNNAFFDSLRLGGVSVTAILDEDNMASDSATALATQQSIKAYVDAQVGANNELSEILSNGNTSSGNNIQMTTTDEVQFRDTALTIKSSVDGQLDIAADVELEIVAPTLDINASTAVTIDTTTMTMTGSVNVVGDLDVDNLNINGNSIISTNTDGNIALTPNGTGEVDITKVDIDGGTIDGVTIGGASAGAGTFTTLTASNILPSADNTYDLGGVGAEWKDLYIDGTANIDSLVADTADINGGTIDGTTIGGASAAAGTFTTATATTGNITTVNATTVDTTNIEVTNIKAKDGTAAGSIADATGVVTLASSVLTTTDINGGTIDGTVIGGSTPAAISGTTGSFSGNLAVDTNTLFVDAASNRVGIGTSSPREGVDLANKTMVGVGNISGSANNGAYSISGGLDVLNGGYIQLWGGSSANPNIIVFGTSSAERARIDASGALLINRTANASTFHQSAISYNANAGHRGLAIQATVQDLGTAITFYNASGAVCGSIAQGTSNTSYNTSSDYRLKENVTPLAGAADRLAQIPVHRFNFIADPDKTVDGFLAHEVQAFVPEAVTGEKDAVDKDGKPVYQGIDQNKLTPLLTAALQEALQKIEALEARITALEA